MQAALRSPDGMVTPLGQLSNSSNVQPPQVVFTSDGTAIAAWAEGSDVNGAIRPPNGTFGAATPIFQGGAGAASLNLVEPATDGAGTALIAFSQTTTAGSTTTAFVRTARASASGFQPSQTVDQDSVSSDSSCNRDISFSGVAVALDAPGNAAIAFTKNVSEFSTDPLFGCLTTNDAEILAARRSQAAGAWTSPTELDSQSLLATLRTWGVAFDAQEEVVVAWTRDNTTRYAVGPPAPASGFSAAQDVPGSGGSDFAQVISAGDAGIMLVLERQTAIDYSIRPPEGSFGAPSPATEAEDPNPPLLASDSAGDVSASWT